MKLSLKLSVLAPGLVALSACGSTGLAPAGEEPMTNDDVLVVYSAGVESMFTDERDAGLKEAFHLLDDRLLELPAELDKEGLPIPELEYLCEVFASPMSLRVDIEGDADWSSGPPLWAQLSVEGTPEHVASLASRLRAFLAGSTSPPAQEAVPGREGLRSISTPVGKVYFGEDDGSFLASLGEPEPSELGLGSLGLPRGIEPDFAMKVDTAKVMPPLMAFLTMSGQETAALSTQLALMGISSESPLAFTLATGHGNGRGYFASRTKNYSQLMAAQGSGPMEPLSASDLDLIPADATFASVSKFDWGMMMKMLDRVMEQTGDESTDPRVLVKQLVGLDLEADLIEPLGTTTGLYMSDTTGGGGLTSTVLYVSVDDEERLRGTIDRLIRIADGLAADAAQGYVTIRSWEYEETTCWTLAFPGLPIPLEMSSALVEGYLLKTVTPQALVAAIDQARGGSSSLLSNRTFRSGAGSTRDLMSASYQDTARVIDDGYGYSSLLFSALSNAVRSRSGDRGPNLVLPPFHELKDGAVPQVIVSRMDGDDLVGSGQMDGSMTANVTAFLGTPVSKVLVAAGALGGFLGARTRSQVAETEALLRALEGDGEHDHDRDHDHDEGNAHDHDEGNAHEHGDGDHDH